MHIKRRDFIGGALALPGLISGQSTDPAVKSVLVMFKCHFDLGFVDTQAAIMRKYFDNYFPHAIQIASSMRAGGSDQYVWTTGSWLLYEYLDQANSVQRKRMEQAVRDGDIAWHALPFSWQTELLDRSLIEGAIGLSKALDSRFGRTTTGAKMTDVPGHTRGLVGPLAASGVTFLDIGVNSASTPPQVPSLFNWKDSDGNSVVVMYHLHEYGGVVRVPGSELAVDVEVRNDNSGPHTIGEIKAIYAKLRRQFPNAQVKAANLTEIANAVQPFRHDLPIVTQEIGDTWIYGVPSDPVKVAHYREVVRLRRDWIAAGKWKVGDARDLMLLRRLTLAAEHTWGTDTKTWLDFDHYTPHDLAQMLDRPNYRTVTGSWVEKRNDIEQGVASLPADLREEAKQRLGGLKAVPPVLTEGMLHRSGDWIETAHFIVGLDSQTGAIQKLRSKASQRDWASAEHPLALFAYQTLSKQDYDRFLANYVKSKADWAPKDFGKPNIDHFGATSHTWLPKLVSSSWFKETSGHRILAELRINDEASEHGGLVAWPESMYLELILPENEALVHLNFFWFRKKANRLPEALWLAFQPDAPETKNWLMEKVDRTVSPLDVVRGGNRHMHALSNSISYKDAKGSFAIETLDAPVVALGEQSPIYFSLDQPEMANGLHFSLFNNGWGTNYIQWFGEDMKFRFTIRA
ncbi:MAG TPA: DUF5054 domain-containing protein [Bryobacteraceae bacterium]|jgi:hypothetical protein